MSALNIGVRAHDFGQGSIEEVCNRIGQYDVSCVQLALPKSFPFMGPDAGRITPGFASKVKNAFAAHNIDIAVLGCYINPVHPDKQIREVSLQWFEEHLQFASDFGCKIVGTETGSINADCLWHPDNHSEKAFNELVTSVRRLALTAEKFGVIIGIEGVAHHHIINTPERLCQLLEAVDSSNVKVIYDPVNFFPVNMPVSQEAAMDEVFAKLGQQIVAVHCKDFITKDHKKFGDLPSGTGEMNHRYLFAWLARFKPDIQIILENTSTGNIDKVLSFLDNQL